MISLSVIIVAYKSRDEIDACLGSLPMALWCGPTEIVVVDNWRKDGLRDFCAEKYPWVQFIEPKENLGFGRANNLGFGNSHGDYILFLNPDTICNAAALEHCVHRLAEEAAIGMISPKLVLLDGNMDAACRRSIPTLWDGFCRASGLATAFPSSALFAGYNLTHLSPEGTYAVGAINGAFMMSRRSTLEKVGLFDEGYFMYGDDLDLCIRVARGGFKVVYDGSTSIVHLKGVSVGKDYASMSHAIFDANREVYLKHFNPTHSKWVEWKYRMAFGLWKRVALFRAKARGHRRVRPV